jgi:hypothetical protein
LGVFALQIQSKYIDDDPNVIDLKNARNANEVITVLSRCNTTFSVLVSKFNQKKLSYLKVTDGVEALQFCLDSLILLRCARTVSGDFNDTKRDRCFSMIDSMQTNIRDFQSSLMDIIDSVCASRMDEHLSYLSTGVYRTLSKIGETTQLHIRLPGSQMICFRTASGITDKNGFVSGPICVKLTYVNGKYAISIPDSPWVASEESIVSTAKDVQTYINGNLSDFDYIGKPVPKDDKLLASKMVQDVDVTDESLVVTLKPSVRPDDINKFLAQVLPYLKRAVNLPNTDIIHRVSQFGNSRSVSFILAKRKIYDPRSLDRVTKLLNVSKAERAKINSIMD